MTAVVTVFSATGLTVAETRTEAMLLWTLGAGPCPSLQGSLSGIFARHTAMMLIVLSLGYTATFRRW